MTDNFDLKNATSLLLNEGYKEQGFESEDEMHDYYNDSDFLDETEGGVMEEEVEDFAKNVSKEISKIQNEIEKARNIALDLTVKLSTSNDENAELLTDKISEDLESAFIILFDILELLKDDFGDNDSIDEGESLEEMAKISGDLKSSIEAVIAANPELEGLALKKAIKGDDAVINALDGEDLYDNQLNKFISLSKGERTVGQRGRVADPNKPAAAPKAEKSSKIKITTPKVTAVAAEPSTKLSDLAPASVFDGEEDEEDMAAEKQAMAAAKGGKRLGSAAEKLAQITKEMKALIPAYQASKGTPEGDAITAQLKALTAEKKALDTKVFK